MRKYTLLRWLAFASTGMIDDYLKYRILEKMDLEAGEEFGTGKDLRDSVEDNQIR